MKKSLLTIITFALVLVNLVLTAVMALTIVPEVKNVNSLISRVSEAIDLDIASGDEYSGGSNVSLENSVPYSPAENLTVPLKKGEDGADHFAQVSVTLYINNSSDSFDSFGAGDLSAYDSVINSQITSTLSNYTKEELNDDISKAYDDIKDGLNAMFGNNLISKVEFSTFLPQ